MTEVLHANVFFFITTVAVVVFTILACVLVYYLIRIVRSIDRIVARIDEGSEVISEDLASIRETLHPKQLMRFAATIFGGRRRRRDDEDYE